MKPRSRDEHFTGPGPKRILCLDGGGVRGVLTLGVLARVERVLAERHGSEVRLCDYFDLIAGTSTGAIIAAALCKGMKVAEVQTLYRDLATRIFQKSFFRMGLFRAKYAADELTAILKEVLGADTTLGSESLQTGLLVVTKRADTGSPWPLSNNPRGYYYDSKEPLTIPNRDYPLWAVVRASTAAPSFFDPELIRIADRPNGTSVTGTFVDGGVSTANNPALLALRFATLSGYRLSWPIGLDQLLIVSLGTGLRNPEAIPSDVASVAALQSLLALMDDCNAEVETMMQWMGKTDTGSSIDSEVGTLGSDAPGSTKLFTYQRYNVELSERGLNRELELGFASSELAAVQEMDAPENVPLLERIGAKLGERVLPSHFPSCFDLESR